MTKTLIGVFEERSDVEEAIDKLKSNGLNAKDFSIVMKDRRAADDIGEDTGAEVAEGALAGATTGAAIGGITGLLAGTVLPGLGGFLIGGPIGAALGLSGAAATTVSGVATGAVAGGLIGALMGLGLSREEAKHYERRVREGAILLMVPAPNEKVSFVKNVFNEYNASDVKTILPQDMQDTSHMGSQEKRRRSDYHQHKQYYATVGAKGGKAKHSGKGWHGDPAGHAKAGRGKKVK